MKPKSIPSIIALTAATLVYVGWADASEHGAQRRAARDPAQARLTVQQAAIIAKVLGNGSVRKVAWTPGLARYEIELATADGHWRNVRVEAYGGRLIDDEMPDGDGRSAG